MDEPVGRRRDNGHVHKTKPRRWSVGPCCSTKSNYRHKDFCRGSVEIHHQPHATLSYLQFCSDGTVAAKFAIPPPSLLLLRRLLTLLRLRTLLLCERRKVALPGLPVEDPHHRIIEHERVCAAREHV